jgi:7,8-dihydropterin-6-yl-methyl-4-(beta-D-ribofuranosyl)aminobenzene 5'-phosphate synthase
MKKIILLAVGTLLILGFTAVLFITARQASAAALAERKWQSTQVEALYDFGSTSRLEILPLYEEAGDQSIYQTGHGLSYLIKTDSATILMDIGNNPKEADTLPLLQNMRALGVSWEQIDAIIFSHFHPDHVGGVKAWKAGKVSFGVDTVDFQGKPVYAPSSFDFPGASTTLLPDPTILSPGVATIGTIEYGEIYPVSLYAASGAEQVLAINVEGKGIVLVMGCGHPTVERIVARAEALFEQPVVGILGGFHYEGKSAEEVQPQIEFLQARDLLQVGLSPHDSSPEAMEAFRSAFPEEYREVQVGLPINFPQ